MKLFAIELPSSGVSFGRIREPLDFVGIGFVIRLAAQLLEIFPDERIHTGAESFGFSTSRLYRLLING